MDIFKKSLILLFVLIMAGSGIFAQPGSIRGSDGDTINEVDSRLFKLLIQKFIE